MKDFQTLIKAFALVSEEIPSRLFIMGEGELREELETLATSLGVADKVGLPGFIDNPFMYLTNAAGFVLSSAWEGLPGALIQAMACDCFSAAGDIFH